MAIESNKNKLPKAKLNKLTIDELSIVDRPCQEPATVTLMKRAPDGAPDSKEPTAINKRSALTTSTNGHTHLLYSLDDTMAGTTSWDAMQASGSDSYGNGHSHPWVRSEDGSITIGEAFGHSHDVGSMSASLAKAKSDEKSTTTEKANETATTKSTRAPDASDKGETMKTVILSEAQHAHYSKLSASEQEAFVNKSSGERDSDVQKALDADAIVFKGERTGIEVRKSQGDFAKKLAEQAEQLAKQSAEQAEQIAKRDQEIKKARIEKLAADTFSNRSSGDVETLAFIVEKLEGNEKAMAVIKGLVATTTVGKQAPGVNAGQEPVEQTAGEQLDEITLKYAADNKVDRPTARVEVLKTAEGKRLYAKSIGRA